MAGEEKDPERHPGMMPEHEWAETDVHKASVYKCGKCGKELESPHEFYDHLDAEHPSAPRSREEGDA